MSQIWRVTANVHMSGAGETGQRFSHYRKELSQGEKHGRLSLWGGEGREGRLTKPTAEKQTLAFAPLRTRTWKPSPHAERKPDPERKPGEGADWDDFRPHSRKEEELLGWQLKKKVQTGAEKLDEHLPLCSTLLLEKGANVKLRYTPLVGF